MRHSQKKKNKIDTVVIKLSMPTKKKVSVKPSGSSLYDPLVARYEVV